MRNLKKILALALALVMSLSLMATANAFTDDDSINDTYETAVTVLSGLKVFQGYDDGSFLPQGAITRAEVAAIIYRIVTGDVADTQVGIYADYNKFDDVASTSWYAGYVNFCANAEYIKGYDARTFGPNDPVTGYQALAMILRALGYDKNGEFTGTNWQVQTAAVGEQRGITKNITAGTLGVPATREVVAEILFRAILVNKVNYTPAFGYTEDDTSIGYDTFKLEEIEGVVVANEYADLYSGSPMKAGRTEMIVDGNSYVIDYTSTLEDIGEAQAAYITGETVLAIGDAGNTVFETGAEADIDSDSNFEEVTALERDASTEYFVNFDGGNTYEASDYRISYVLEFANGAATVAFEEAYDIDIETLMDETSSGSNSWRKVIRPGNEITADDLTVIEAIFDDADRIDEIGYVMGEVYIGTQSVDDISDEISYREFLDEYVTTGENSKTVDGNENGNWLKVVDNDGDGVADVVMKTIYTGAGVEDIDRDGNIELTVLNTGIASNHYDNLNDLDEDIDVVSADELSEGDVVYYAVIDGNAQTYLAEMVTAEIDSVNRRTLTATTTDGDEYVESDVHDHVGWDGFESGVRNLEGNTSYDLYLDKYGNLMTFVQSATSGDFVLLTNGYFQTGRTEDIYAAMVWDSEAQELVDTDITSGGSLFIYDDRNDNDWDNLKAFEDINDNGSAMLTIVAALNEDGELVPVEDVFTRQTVNIIDYNERDDDGNRLIPGRDYQTGTAYYTDGSVTAYDTAGIDDKTSGENVEFRALSTTVYYYVYMDGDDAVVNEYVGYSNLPDLKAGDAAKIEDVYAVGTLVDRVSGSGQDNQTEYYTANVIVVEFNAPYDSDAEEVFVVDAPVIGNNLGTEFVEVIRADGTYETVEIDLAHSSYRHIEDAADVDYVAHYGPAGRNTLMPGLYYMWETSEEGVYTITTMTAQDIKNSNYSVGVVSTADNTYTTDWAEVREYTFAGYTSYDLDDTATNDRIEYQVVEDSVFFNLGYSVVNNEWRADLDDEATAADVLDELGDPDTTTARPHAHAANTVLVKYDGDDIVYAISFANYDGENTAGTAMVTNFAQYVWNAAKPAADYIPSDEVGVTVSFGSDELTAETTEYTTWTEASKALEGNSQFSAVATNNGTVLTDPTLPVELTTAGGTFTFQVAVQSEDGDNTVVYNYTVIVPAAETGNELLDVNAIAEIDATTVNLGNGELAALTEDDLTVSDNATAVIDKDAKTITVTSEAGVANVYNIVEGSFVTINDDESQFIENGHSIALPAGALYYVSSNVTGQAAPGPFNITAAVPAEVAFTGYYEATLTSDFSATDNTGANRGTINVTGWTVNGKAAATGAAVTKGDVIVASVTVDEGYANSGETDTITGADSVAAKVNSDTYSGKVIVNGGTVTLDNFGSLTPTLTLTFTWTVGDYGAVTCTVESDANV